MLQVIWVLGLIYIIAMVVVIIWTRRQNKEPEGKAPRSKVERKPLSEELKEQREAHDMSVEYVAKSVHTSPETVSAWEEGTAVPGTSGLFALASLYGISMDELMGGEQPQ